jgi:transposase-like protein
MEGIRTYDWLVLADGRTYVKVRGESDVSVSASKINTKITLDTYAASHCAITELKTMAELLKRVRVRSSKYLNSAIEQDHRRVKQRLRPMLGFKSFHAAAVVIVGIEPAEKIKKGQL